MRLRVLFISPGPKYRISEHYCKLMSGEYDVIHLTTKDNIFKDNGKKIGNYIHYYSFFNQRLPFLSKIIFIIFCIMFSMVLRIKGKKIDLVTAYDPLKTGLIGLVCSKILGAPCIVQVNGVYTNRSNFDEKHNLLSKMKIAIIPLIQGFVLNRVSGIKLLFGKQLKGFKVDTRRVVIECFPNYIDVKHFANYRESKINEQILFVGFPFLAKGVDILIRAFKLISDKNPTWDLKILGWYPDNQLLTSHIGNHPNIQYHPPVMYSEMPFHMGECSIFVLPSRTEGMGRVLIEAMASKKPCIGSNLDGIPEVIVDGVTGYLFTPGNSEDLADKMEILINNKRLRIQMGNEGFKRVNDYFNTDLFLKRTKNFYDKVIQKAG